MVTRRSVLIGTGAIALGAVGFVAADGKDIFYAALTEDFPGGVLTVQDAHSKAVVGEITLVDIRRPDEWAKTGSGEGAHRLDLRRDDFPEAMAALVSGNLDAPIALICARIEPTATSGIYQYHRCPRRDVGFRGWTGVVAKRIAIDPR